MADEFIAEETLPPPVAGANAGPTVKDEVKPVPETESPAVTVPIEDVVQSEATEAEIAKDEADCVLKVTALKERTLKTASTINRFCKKDEYRQAFLTHYVEVCEQQKGSEKWKGQYTYSPPSLKAVRHALDEVEKVSRMVLRLGPELLSHETCNSLVKRLGDPREFKSAVDAPDSKYETPLATLSRASHLCVMNQFEEALDGDKKEVTRTLDPANTSPQQRVNLLPFSKGLHFGNSIATETLHFTQMMEDLANILPPMPANLLEQSRGNLEL